MKLAGKVVIGIGAAIVVFAGVTGKDPRSIVAYALGGDLRDLPGLPKTTSGGSGSGGSGGGAGGGAGGGSGGGGSGRPPLESKRGFQAAPAAWAALGKAESEVGHQISITSAYRSPEKQKKTCEHVCGNPSGCPGTCAAPGTSCHDKGLAFDIGASDCHNAKVRAALQHAGFCNFGPSDPCHFCLDGCY